MTPRVVAIGEGRADIARAILADLPDWFAIPESTRAYVAACADLPMLGAPGEGGMRGFVSLKDQSAFAAELFVLGVRRRLHRQGIGRALVEAAADHAARRGLRFLTVKTVAPSRPDPFYEATRRFYEAVGFLPLEEFPTLWGSSPCLMMIRPL